MVAQSRENMAIWYNMDAPERVTLIDIKGDIVDIARDEGKTEVIVQEGQHQGSMLQNVFAVAKLWQIFYLLKAFARFQMDCTKHGALKLKDMMASIYPIVKPIGYN